MIKGQSLLTVYLLSFNDLVSVSTCTCIRDKARFFVREGRIAHGNHTASGGVGSWGMPPGNGLRGSDTIIIIF